MRKTTDLDRVIAAVQLLQIEGLTITDQGDGIHICINGKQWLAQHCTAALNQDGFKVQGGN